MFPNLNLTKDKLKLAINFHREQTVASQSSSTHIYKHYKTASSTERFSFPILIQQARHPFICLPSKISPSFAVVLLLFRRIDILSRVEGSPGCWRDGRVC